MLFNVDEDEGERLVAWLVPDNPSSEPALTVVIDGHARQRIVANDFRAQLKSTGLHPTGICGFVIDPAVCPAMPSAKTLELYDAESNLLVFRRPDRPPRALRHFHLETQSFPIYELDRELSPYVQMSYASVELIGEETLVSICNIGFSPSVLVCGGLTYKRYAAYLRAKTFTRSIILCDPLREIAGRLLRMQMLGREGGGSGGWKGLGQSTLIDAVAEADLRDPASIAKALRTLSDEDFFSLADPTTRKLVAISPTDALQDHHVSAALDSLAEFEVVGFEADIGPFVDGMEALAGDMRLSRAKADDPPGFDEILRAVTACRPVRELVRLDMTVLDLARTAIDKASIQGAAGALA